MKLTRRHTLVIGTGALVATGLVGAPAQASLFEEAYAALTGNAPVIEGGVTLTLPAVAEDGYTVPLGVSAPGEAVAITVLAEHNPAPRVARFRFGPLSGARDVSTRIRLARTQTVVALAEMPDGSFRIARTHVDVTLGGCGA
ncbi:thiosulfate oxidation carrier protein SoxY [uncultured Roseobacter sp.]|uniref:thiosulfate oxidation carrier protein SoxY n=1 Tax=uncultured Roseobacter sp. TaxID=114847 RepID=UPI00263414E4|nr:thiosulfate oxidation carrier protein SoxY [uncultured Roseobacter sp.]